MLNFNILCKSNMFKDVQLSVIEQNFSMIDYKIAKFEKDDFIVMRGEILSEMKFILSGNVRAEMTDNDKTTKIEDLKAPMALAPSFLFGDENTYPVDVIANQDVEILSIHKDQFIKLMQINKTILENYLSRISSKTQFLARRIKLLSLRTIRQKLATYILNFAGDKLNSFELPMTQTKLAEYFAVARPPLTRAFAELEKENIITINARLVTILDKKKLAEVANK